MLMVQKSGVHLLDVVDIPESIKFYYIHLYGILRCLALGFLVAINYVGIVFLAIFLHAKKIKIGVSVFPKL